MSYNIDSVSIESMDAKIKKADLRRLLRSLDTLPESNFLEEHSDHEPDGDGYIKLASFYWCGESSGRAFEDLVKKVSKKIVGHVEAIFTWEGGDSVSGLIIKDGEATECDVEMRLVRPETVKAPKRVSK